MNRAGIISFFFVLAFNTHAASLLTPFESSSNFELPASQQVSHYLETLARRSKNARVIELGISAGKRPVNALLLSNKKTFIKTGQPDPDKLTVMLIGAQHGNEPAGAEALQILARDIALGADNKLLESMNFVIVALANPDGRDMDSRHNAADENPNIDYIAVKAEETQMYINAINRFQPNVIYDVHESGVYKSVLTDEQGYYTDVQAQFEVGNNPNIDVNLRHYSENVFLPALIKQVTEAGLPAIHYRGEITRLEQVVKRGGIGISNLRNYAAMHGCLSVLVENRLDSNKGTYPTPRNIKQRVTRQLLSAKTLLNIVHQDASRILSLTQKASQQWRSTKQGDRTIAMEVAFAVNPKQPEVQVPLTEKKSGKRVFRTFENHNLIVAEQKQPLPENYVITGFQKQFAAWLNKHHIEYTVVKSPAWTQAHVLSVKNLKFNATKKPGTRDIYDLDLDQKSKRIKLKPGDLVVSMQQPKAALAAAMLDPRSTTAVFQEPQWQKYLLEIPFPLALTATTGKALVPEYRGYKRSR